MWKNIVGLFFSWSDQSHRNSDSPLFNSLETNIMVGTHADVLVSEAVVKGFGGSFDTALAYEAVYKDATVPPEGDDYLR